LAPFQVAYAVKSVPQLSPFPSPSLVRHHSISILPNFPLVYPLPCNPFAASVNSFCHALSGTNHHTPLATSLCLSIYLYFYFSYLSLISHFLTSNGSYHIYIYIYIYQLNDIYAILIEYLLYMHFHIQAFSFPLPSSVILLPRCSVYDRSV